MSFHARPAVRRLALLSATSLALFGLGLARPGSPSAASTADEATLTSLVNGARAAAGLPPLATSAALSATARSHSAAMAAAGSLFHSGDLAGAIGDSVAGWTNVAENVAVAGSVTQAHQSLMASAAHRANVLGDFTLLGVGVVTGGDGRVWVTEHFAKTATVTVAMAPEPVPEPEPVPVPEPEPVAVVEAAAVVVEPAPAPAPVPVSKPRPKRVASRPQQRVAAAQPSALSNDVSCLPPPAQDHGRGHAYGRCDDGPASDRQGRPGR